MNWKTITAISVLAAAGGGAFWYFQRQKKLLEDYDKSVQGFKVVSFSLQAAVINFIIRFTNKSDISATVKKMDADIYLGNTYAGHVTQTEQVLIPARGYADIPLQISFSPQTVLKDILPLLIPSFSLNNVAYRVQGNVKIKSGFIGVPLPFDFSGTLSDI